MNDERFQKFAQEILDCVPEERSLDPFDIQDLALNHKLFKKVLVSEPCSELCQCQEYDGDFPLYCLHTNFERIPE